MIDNIEINTQSSIKITTDKIIYFDPFKIEEETHDADLIFITHDHYDHFDVPSIKKVMKGDTTIVIPDSIAPKVLSSGLNNRHIIGVNPNELYNILNYQVETVPSYNIDKQFHPKNNKYVGYIITINNKRLYVSGDTDVTEEVKNVSCDIALIPIGGTFTCTYEEAAKWINKIKPSYVIPTHYGSIVGSLKDGEKFASLLDDNIKCILKIR